MARHLLESLFFLLCAAATAGGLDGATRPLQRFENAEWLETAFNDGDSFLVRFLNPGTGRSEEHVLRLYFVDCNEIIATRESDKRRVRQQARYFGVDDTRVILDFGAKAKDFVRRVLAGRFTVHTSFANAEGRSAEPRHFAFITTRDGDDLAELLVRNGLARNYGVDRETPGGVSAADYKAHLGDLELRAAMKGQGVWEHSDPDRIVSLREQERDERRELEEIGVASDPSGARIDINAASVEELVRLPQIGEVIAERIIDARPFQEVEDLLRVDGIGKITLDKIRDHITVSRGH